MRATKAVTLSAYGSIARVRAEGQHWDSGDSGLSLVLVQGSYILRQPAGRAGADDVGEVTRRTADAGPGGWPLREADVGQIEQGLERALRTRPVPASTAARLRFLLASHGGSTRRVAAVLGVSQRTVQRWVTKKPGAPPGPGQVRAIEQAVLARWQPRVRARQRAPGRLNAAVVGGCRGPGWAAGVWRGTERPPRVPPGLLLCVRDTRALGVVRSAWPGR
ncbi:helix-turn-helix domain-containing protein [Streptomyces anulatus]|uniref:helix-turn-helix domain-containing protein n=1 Tax=Streptomyces anulatus TaxID=1892 RepID=UPI00386F8E67